MWYDKKQYDKDSAIDTDSVFHTINVMPYNMNIHENHNDINKIRILIWRKNSFEIRKAWLVQFFTRVVCWEKIHSSCLPYHTLVSFYYLISKLQCDTKQLKRWNTDSFDTVSILHATHVLRLRVVRRKLHSPCLPYHTLVRFYYFTS